MMPTPSPPAGRLRFVSATHDDPLAQPLLAELAVEYAQRYGG
ncbi:MAG: GNAT family N-acetyltransferase, partial [Mycobacterium sp.]